MISGSGGRPFAGAILAVAIPWALLPGMAVAAEFDASVQQQIRAATFEVVQLRPLDGDVTYERPLPMELVPYQQRTVLYRSVGPTFTVGSNRYVTAGHVVALGVGSQLDRRLCATAPARCTPSTRCPSIRIMRTSRSSRFASRPSKCGTQSRVPNQNPTTRCSQLVTRSARGS